MSLSPGLRWAALPLEWVVFVQNAETEISGGLQTIDETSVLGGLYFPRLWQSGNLRLRGHAFVGHARYQGQREVFTNFGGGSLQTTASFQSLLALGGLEAVWAQPVTSWLDAQATFAADIEYESTRSYEESTLFSWDERRLVQGVLSAQAGLVARPWNRTSLYAQGGVIARELLSGRTATVRMNGSAGDFSGGVNGQTRFRGTVGFQHQLTPRATIGLEASAFLGENDASGWSTAATLGFGL
ncbi:MAG: hypothetical protein ACFB20_12485 [Opitutales bacterium]